MGSMEAVTAYEGKMDYIFVSYSHKNRKAVYPVLQKLSEANYRMWYDEGIMPGDKFAKTLFEKISNCCAVLLFLSNETFTSTYCKFEILTAYAKDKRICPFLLVDSNSIDIPVEFQPIINSSHQINLNDIEGTDVNAYINRLPFEAKDIMLTSEDKKTVLQGEKYSKLTVIPSGVTTIGEDAYKERTELCKIEFNDVRNIEKEAFRGCSGLESLTIPGTICKVGDSAFRDCIGIRELIIEKNIEGEAIEIGERAFENCVNVYAINLPVDLKEIYSGCFNSCRSLMDIEIPMSVTSIGESAFGGCISLKKFLVHSNITKLDDLAFSGCTGLKTIYLSEGLLKIGKNTFKDCTSLTQISIPSTVTKMGTSPFRGCYNLEKIIVEKSKYFKQDDGVLFNKNKSMLICFPPKKVCDKETYVIPDSVVEICEWAFADAHGIKSIVIPDSVTEIGEGAFFRCKMLEEIVIPDSVIRIDDITFRGCENLRSIVVPDSVIEIGWGIVSGCHKDLVVKCRQNSKIFEYCQDRQIATSEI